MQKGKMARQTEAIHLYSLFSLKDLLFDKQAITKCKNRSRSCLIKKIYVVLTLSIVVEKCLLPQIIISYC